MEWEHKYYSQLKGYTIDSFEFEVDDVDEGYDSRFPTFTLTKRLGNFKGASFSR